VLIPLTLLDDDKRKGFELMDRFCFELVSNVSCFELSFPISGGFWQPLEEAVENPKAVCEAV